MGKFKRDYSDVDIKEGGGYSGDVPKPGMYDGVLVSCSEHTSGAGNEGTEWVFEITEEPYAGWRGWVYSNDEGAAWKEVQILMALGIISDKDDPINTTHEKIMKDGGPVRLKVKNETYEEEKRGRITAIMAPPEGATKTKKAKKKKDKGGDDETPF